MAKSSGIGGLIKWIVIVAILVVGYREGWPWLKAEIEKRSGSSSSGASIDFACAGQADHANLTWGSGIGRFVNPPVDATAWNSFRAEVDGEIRQARSACSCAQPSCSKAREALADLDSLIMSFDAAIRHDTSPGMDVVTRQEAIDSKIELAASLEKSGT